MKGSAGPPTSSPERRPLPKITDLNRGFWEHARGSVLDVQACLACGDRRMPESPVCPRGLDSAQEWQPVNGRGTLEAWADFHRAYWDDFKGTLLYRVCLVRLAEGPLLISQLVGDSAAARLGAPLRVVFEKITD